MGPRFMTMTIIPPVLHGWRLESRDSRADWLLLWSLPTPQCLRYNRMLLPNCSRQLGNLGMLIMGMIHEPPGIFNQVTLAFNCLSIVPSLLQSVQSPVTRLRMDRRLPMLVRGTQIPGGLDDAQQCSTQVETPPMAVVMELMAS